MTFFFALYLTLGGKLDICGRVDLFFAFDLTFRGKLDIWRRVDFLFFALLLTLTENGRL